MNKYLKLLCLLAIALCFVNFFAFGVGSTQNGDALSGYQAGGHYFLAGGGHLTEVTRDQWNRNRLQGLSLYLTHPLGMALIFVLLFKEKFPKMMLHGSDEERRRKEELVCRSGPAKVAFTCEGKVGPLRLGGAMLRNTVYPAGLHCRPRWLPSFAILNGEIQSVSALNSRLRKGVEIVHTSPEVVSPIYLACANNAAAMKALLALEPNAPSDAATSGASAFATTTMRS